MTTVFDLDGRASSTALGADRLNLAEDGQTVGDSSKDDVLAVEPWRVSEAEEELGAVRVGASIGHRQNSLSLMSVDEVFVVELGSVDGFASSTVSGSEVTALGHEAGDDSVEERLFEVESLSRLASALLARAESAEVLGSLGGVVEELHGDAAGSLAADRNIEENVGWHFFRFYL